MHTRHTVLVLAAAVILTSVASAGPVAVHAAESRNASPASAAPSSAAAAPAPSRIAFVAGVWKPSPSGPFMQTELYVMNADGSGKRRLVRSASGRSSSPVWSPDGRELSFEKTLGPAIGQCGVCHTEIFVVNVDGGEERNLTRNSGGGIPAWSPDGQQIAFSRGNQIPNLYVMNADGSGEHRVTQEAIHVWGASWSPDTRRLAFASGVQGNPGNFKIYVVNVDGSSQQQLTRDLGADLDPAWSPDGRRIAFRGVRLRSGRRGFTQEIYVTKADGSEQRKLARLSNRDGSFSWSPDGQRIAFVSDRDGNDEVYVINVDGSGLRRLTRNPARDGHPAWSPDGGTIGFVSNRGGNRDIYVMNADGSRQRNLTRGLDQQAFGIAWSPAQTK